MALQETKGRAALWFFYTLPYISKHEESRLKAAEFLHEREIRMIISRCVKIFGNRVKNLDFNMRIRKKYVMISLWLNDKRIKRIKGERK
ncbi:hypothetical protein ABD75_00930 [Bacillus vallismortis]|nr:hypothetical protein [Bacillus vallismortis]